MADSQTRAAESASKAVAVRPPSARSRFAVAISARATAVAEVLRSGDLRLLGLAWAGSNLGQWAATVAVSVLAYQVGGAAGVGLYGVAKLAPAAIATPFTGGIADRFPRQRVIAAVAGWKVAELLLLAGVAAGDLGLLPLLLVVGAGGMIASALRPAFSSVVPSLIQRPEELASVNSFMSLIEAFGSLIGPLIAAALLATAPTSVVLLVAAAPYAACAVAAGLIRARPVPRRASSVTAPSIGGRLAAYLRSFSVLTRDRGVGLLVALFAAQGVVAGLVSVVVVVASIELLGMGREGAGTLYSALGIGGLAGALLSLGLTGRRRLAVPFALSLLAWGVPIFVVGVAPIPWLAIAMMAVVGVGNAFEDVIGFTLLQRIVPDRILARAFGGLWTLFVVSSTVGAVGASALIHLFGVRTTLVVGGLVLPVTLALCSRGLHLIDDEAEVPEREIGLLNMLPFFAPLPAVALEHLARELELERVPAGTDIVRQGDAGDRFYVIGSGRVLIVVDGDPVRELDGGDYFGEIALVRDVPRTATVRALEDSELYSLHKEPFIAAVSGRDDSEEALAAIIGRRLGSRHPAVGGQ